MRVQNMRFFVYDDNLRRICRDRFLPALGCLVTLAVRILALFVVDPDAVHLSLECCVCNVRVLIASVLLLSDIHTQDFATTGMLGPEAGRVVHKFRLISIRLHLIVSTI
jgi:hypothetical protein